MYFQAFRLNVVIVLFLLPLAAMLNANSYAQSPVLTKFDSDKKPTNESGAKEAKIKRNFSIVENYMNINQYDSAQLWINKIAELVPIQKASVSSYLLSSRQSEIYYYNRLLQLGLQESKRSLKIAKALNDSLLLADAFNFTGLFYLNLDSAAVAISNFRQGINFIRITHNSLNSPELTKAHHLYGNLSEAFEKLGKFDSALIYAKLSLQQASIQGSERGRCVALNSLATNYLKLKMVDTAIRYFNLSIAKSKIGKHIDINLLNYGGLAKAYQLNQNNKEALRLLDSGFELITENPTMNKLFETIFLNDAILVYKSANLKEKLISALQLKNEFLQNQIWSNSQQVNIILNASLRNETRILSLQVEKAEQQSQKARVRLYYLSALLVLGIIAFTFYRYGINQKLQKSNLRNEISKDLHDDVGSSLSSLNLYSTVAIKVLDSNPDKAKEMLQKISDQSLLVMENISDIVWSMKTATDESVSLSTKIKILVADTLSAAEINYKIDIDASADSIVQSIAARRTILMIIKEAINNAVKHSRASNISIRIKNTNNFLNVIIEDDGKGFLLNSNKKLTNGLINMQKRSLELKGKVEIQSRLGEGTLISANFPLSALNKLRFKRF